ncbi:glycoside hydrolase family 18 protein [Tahibacter amnicola]|uniref:chitinase n=1 Tax=Tahibacter amnicola TaxID=2976241 RepID=A0ABY6B9V7_9GAMM|nr:glycoside hydrolase family 18 protein [Tahibacter amnicola]UXI66848.1 glycoside hydrolase family 18 protein [Tahibacter amnicola]
MSLLRSLALSALPLLAASDACADDTIFAGGFQKPWISGYHVGYQRDMYPIAEIDFSTMTHLMVGRVTPTSNGGVTRHFDIDNTNGPIFAQQASNAAHAAGIKAVLMVGGAGEYSNWVSAASPANRANFVANLLDVMDDLGYDGLDLDWEPIQTSDEPNFIALAQALRTARPDMILTVPVGWINANFAGTTNPFFASIAPLFDQINIMSYDMAGDWGGWQSWFSSALTGHAGNTPSSLEVSAEWYRRSGVPRSRIGVGIPFYGTCWRNVSAPRLFGGTVVASDNVMSYHNIMQSYYSAGLRQWDTAAMAPWLGSNAPIGPQQCNFISYDDEQSIAAKGAYVRRNGLGGTIIWTIAEGHLPERPAGQRDPLLQAVKAAF